MSYSEQSLITIYMSQYHENEILIRRNIINVNNNNNDNNNDLSNVLSDFLNSTVVVRPTNEQIQNASRIVRYGDIDNPLSQVCPISLDEFNDGDQIRQLLYCKHLFHQNQFQEWFKNNVRCPVCRYDVRNYIPLSRRNTPETSVSLTPSTILTTTPLPTTPTENTTNDTLSNRDNTNITPLFNINFTRVPVSNQIEQVTFNITNQEFTDNLINQIARNIFQFMLNSRS